MHEYDRLKMTSGYIQYKALRTFSSSFQIYIQNRVSYKRSIDKYYSRKLLSKRNASKRWRVQREIIRNIHNLIFSIIAYKEYVYKNIQETDDKSKIDKCFVDNDQFHVIRVLRNHIAHSEVLPLISRMKFNKDRFGQLETFQYESMFKRNLIDYLEEIVNKNPKREYDKRALNWLKNEAENINLSYIFDSFHSTVASFHAEFILGFTKANLTILDTLSKEVQLLHTMASELNIDQSMLLSHTQLRHLNLLLYKAKKTN